MMSMRREHLIAPYIENLTAEQKIWHEVEKDLDKTDAFFVYREREKMWYNYNIYYNVVKSLLKPHCGGRIQYADCNL